MERRERQQLWRKIGGEDIGKEAELANTYDMPASYVPEKGAAKGKLSVIPKTASAEQAILGDEHNQLELDDALTGEQPPSLPQMTPLRPRVDVSGTEPPKVVQEKKAQHYALPELELYPLDSYTQVKAASQYFMETFKFMPPESRHEYCQNLVKRASALDIVTDPIIEKYGSAGYARESDITVCLDARRTSLLDEDKIALLDKLAASRAELPPETFAAALEQFDKVACLDVHYGDIPDAYYTTFGKTAAEELIQQKTDPLAAIVIGNEYLTRRRLAAYIQNNVGSIETRFGEELAKDMSKDPNGIFDSLPRDQKLVIMRMANNDDSPVKQGDNSV